MQNTTTITRTITRATYTVVFLVIAVLLPQFCHIVGGVQISSQISPMHLPVYLCAIFAGPLGAMAVGLLAPILSSLIFGMPIFPAPMLPMCLELMTYGMVFGMIYSRIAGSGSHLAKVVCALLGAMVAGRIVLLLANLVLVDGYSVSNLVSNAIVNQVTGMIIQLLLVPLVAFLVDKLK